MNCLSHTCSLARHRESSYNVETDSMNLHLPRAKTEDLSQIEQVNLPELVILSIFVKAKIVESGRYTCMPTGPFDIINVAGPGTDESRSDDLHPPPRVVHVVSAVFDIPWPVTAV